MSQATVAVKPVSGANFMKGVKAAKRMGGKFDGSVWHIPASRPELGALGAYSLVRVATDRCPQWSTEHGCPLHGETCNGAGR